MLVRDGRDFLLRHSFTAHGISCKVPLAEEQVGCALNQVLSACQANVWPCNRKWQHDPLYKGTHFGKPTLVGDMHRDHKRPVGEETHNEDAK